MMQIVFHDVTVQDKHRRQIFRLWLEIQVCGGDGMFFGFRKETESAVSFQNNCLQFGNIKLTAQQALFEKFIEIDFRVVQIFLIESAVMKQNQRNND